MKRVTMIPIVIVSLRTVITQLSAWQENIDSILKIESALVESTRTPRCSLLNMILIKKCHFNLMVVDS